MLNNILNSQVSHALNEINRLNFLNKQREQKNKNKDKYNIIYIDKQNYFKIPNNINLNSNLRQLQNDLTNKNINEDIKKINNVHKLNFKIPNNINLNSNLDQLLNDLTNKNINEDIKKINKDIKKINNVHKLNFKNAPSTGFGDFIRGCYFLLQFSEQFNIDVDFHIYDSNIKYYIKYFALKPIINEQIANNIFKFTKINATFTNNNGIIDYDIDNKFDDFINYLNSQYVYSNNNFINTVYFPSHFISKIHINYMKTILEPTIFFKIEINNLMDKLGLIKKDFVTYHIRLGDNYLENQYDLIQNNKLYQILDKLNIEDDNNYLLLSDSMVIKNILSKKYSKLKTIENEIIHTNKNDDRIKNTLLDFYLMSNSKKIISFSIYPHGSGFSKWCATTYEIPYICYSLL
jgi:hypothetical protein